MKRMGQGVNNITEGVIWKQLLLFFFPLWLGIFFQQLYNTVDTVVVGQFVGKTALAAVGSAGAVTNLTVGLFTGLSNGAVVMVAQPGPTSVTSPTTWPSSVTVHIPSRIPAPLPLEMVQALFQLDASQLAT